MQRRTTLRVVVAAAVLPLVGASCGGDADLGGSPTGSTGVTGSPSPTPVAAVELDTDGLALVAFGTSMDDALPMLVGALGEPVDEIREQGDLPFGYGDLDSTVRRVDFGGLYVVFGDWRSPYRDDGVMHTLGWGASEAATASGTPLWTPEGIGVGSSVAELRTALPSVDLTVDEGCTGPPWYFWSGPGSYLVSLSASPAEDGARVVGLFAGEQREGFATC